MKNILVSIDFDEHTEQLINRTAELAGKYNSIVWILHVAAPDPDFVGLEVGPQYIRDHKAAELKKEHKLLFEYANKLKAKGIEATGLLIQGATIETILNESKKLTIDLVIIGHHHHTFLYKTFFGNTSLDVIKKSNIPVLVVPLGNN